MWSSEELSSSPPSLDLSHLSEEERQVIQSVIERQKALENETFLISNKISKELTTYEVKKEARSKSSIQDLQGNNGMIENCCEICHRTEFRETTEKKLCKYCKMNVCENCGEEMKAQAPMKMVSMAAGESLVVWRRCTPFCEKAVECPEHHELLQAIVNCTDQLGHLSNLEILKSCVEKYESIGWSKDDDIPDPVVGNRFPLIHWATSLGKCNALEWMVNSGFDPCVTVTGLGENALHRCILYLYKSRSKFTVKELKPKFSKIVSLLPQLLSRADSVNRDTPLHTAASMLLNTDVRVSFFQVAVEVIALHTQRLSDAERMEILDARNDDGDTALHILAGVSDRVKIEYACSAISSLIQANSDKTIRNNSNLTPLDIAIAKGFDTVIDELVKITPSKPLSAHTVKHSPSSNKGHSPLSMVSRERSSPRPSSNGSCTMVSPAEINGYSSVIRGISERSGLQNLSPVNVKEEPIDEPVNGNVPSLEETVENSLSTEEANALLNDANSPLLKHLQEAGLLTEVSSLLLRAKLRDESQLKKVQQQAKDLDTQIRYKRNEIEKINQEVDMLYGKRKKCDDEVGQLRKRLMSCQNAIKEIPNKVANHKSA